MYTSVILLTIIYIIILLYVYLKYNLDAKDNSEYDKMYREKLDISASEAAYLLDKNCNSLDLILADILTLIQRDYIKMEIKGEGKQRDYIFIQQEDKNFANMKSHEMSSYRLFFAYKNEISLRDYLNKLKKDVNYLKELEVKSLSIKNDIEYELRRQEITDVNAEKKLFKFNKFSIKLIFIFMLGFIVTLLMKNIEYIELSSIGLLFSILFYRTTTLKEDKLTKYGVVTRKKAIGFKNFLEQYVISKDKPLYMVNVLEYNYIMAVAFGLAKLGENEFIHNTYTSAQMKKIIPDLINKAIIIVIIVYELILLFEGEI